MRLKQKIIFQKFIIHCRSPYEIKFIKNFRDIFGNIYIPSNFSNIKNYLLNPEFTKNITNKSSEYDGDDPKPS